MANRLLPVLAVLVLGAPITQAGDGPGFLRREGTVRLASGSSAHFAWSYYQRDENALANAVSSGDSVVALTDAGALLRFDRATLRLTKESSTPVAVTCLGRGEGDTVLAGFAEGRIVRVNPNNLEVTELARSTGEVAWVGVTTAGAEDGAKRPRIVAVVTKPRLVVHDLGKGRTHVVDPEPAHPDAFLLDRKGRLWLGWDSGEWGGSCLFVDLASGQVHDIPSPRPKVAAAERGQTWEGVYGFTELHDGQVWAHGGTMHMGGASGFICRVDRGEPEELYYRDNLELIRRETERRLRAEQAEDERPGDKPAPAKAAPEPPFDLNRPFVPITQIIEEPGTRAIVVMAFGEMYRTDAKLAEWRKFDELEISYRAGRRDAVGVSPSVRSVEPIAPTNAGRPMGYLFATRLDGLVRVADGKTTRSTPLAQLAVESTGRIVASSDGILLFPAPDNGQEDDAIWRHRDGSWSQVSYAPPYRAHPDAEGEKGAPPDLDWSWTTTLVGRDGTISAVSEVFYGDLGTRTTARWHHGKADVIGSEVSTLTARACFITPDGTLWNAEDSILRRFNDGKWVDTAPDPQAVRREDWNGLALRMTAVNESGPPWILHDRESDRLLRLEYGPGFHAPRLRFVSLREPGLELQGRTRILDAIAWTKDSLLLATDRGLKVFTIDGEKLSAAAIDTGNRPVTRLAQDGRGRLWFGGGQGLMMLDADGKTLHPLDAVPRLGRSKVEALAADPGHADGVIAAIADRGVVFLVLPHVD